MGISKIQCDAIGNNTRLVASKSGGDHDCHAYERDENDDECAHRWYGRSANDRDCEYGRD